MALTIGEMLIMQNRLQQRYRDIWSPIEPSNGRNKLLYGIGEIGEMIDILKKQGDAAVMSDPSVRARFVEETADVLMYLMDVLNCYSVSEDEMETAYRQKHEANLGRW